MPNQSFLADSDWDSPSFLERYSPLFSSNYIAELFCHLAFVNDFSDPFDIRLPTKDPSFQVPDLLIHCTTARSAKVWPFERWAEVIDFASSQGMSVGLVGSAPSTQRESYNSGDGEDWLISSTSLIDLRGRTSLSELAGACRLATGVISVDAGPLHIAAAVGTRVLAIVGNDSNSDGASPIRLWLPKVPNLSRTVSSETCQVCINERFRNDHCLVSGHPCMYGVDTLQVIAWIKSLLPSGSSY